MIGNPGIYQLAKAGYNIENVISMGMNDSLPSSLRYESSNKSPQVNCLHQKLVQVKLHTNHRQFIVNPQKSQLRIADGDMYPREQLAEIFGYEHFCNVRSNLGCAIGLGICVGTPNGIYVQQTLYQKRSCHPFMVRPTGRAQLTYFHSFLTILDFTAYEHWQLSNISAAVIEHVIHFFRLHLRRESFGPLWDLAGRSHRHICLSHRLSEFLHHTLNLPMLLQLNSLRHSLGRNYSEHVDYQKHACVRSRINQHGEHNARNPECSLPRLSIQSFPCVTDGDPTCVRRALRRSIKSIFSREEPSWWYAVFFTREYLKSTRTFINSDFRKVNFCTERHL